MNAILAPRHIFLIVTALLLLVLGLGNLIQPPQFDSRILAVIAKLQSPMLDGFFRLITWAGSLMVLLPVAGLWSYGMYRYGYRLQAVRIVCSLLGASLLSYLIKLLIARPRPEDSQMLIEPAVYYAFPSSHTAQITAFVGMLIVTVKCIRPSWQMHAILSGVGLILLIAFSRLYLQVHYPTDVAGGLFCGLLATGLCLELTHKRCNQSRTGNRPH